MATTAQAKTLEVKHQDLYNFLDLPAISDENEQSFGTMESGDDTVVVLSHTNFIKEQYFLIPNHPMHELTKIHVANEVREEHCYYELYLDIANGTWDKELQYSII